MPRKAPTNPPAEPPKTRVSDSLGEVEIDADALYGAQTQRAIQNFPISGRTLPRAFVEALLLVKETAAAANGSLECIDAEISQAIVDVCRGLSARADLMAHFPVDVFQTGSGTSSNMNANEVISTLATRQLGRAVNANDHVNFGQSSNDVIPTTIHVSAALQIHHRLIPALEELIGAIETRAAETDDLVKTGRTHLMDAMPVRLSQSLRGWSGQLVNNLRLLTGLQAEIQTLGMGGTAVGTGINTHPDFASTFVGILSNNTGLKFVSPDNLFPYIGSQDTAVALSGQLKALAVSMMKIANDLRWMNSGPLAGLGEITLQALQPGSSIMPGKVNPVLPEAVAMVAAQVIGNDTAVTVGGQAGNFELNVMLPMIAANVLESIDILSSSAVVLARHAVATFTVNEEKLQESLGQNPILVTALNPILGYAKAAEIAKQAYREKRPIFEVARENTDLSAEELQALLDPAKLTRGGL